MARDKIIVTYHNVKVQEVASRETEAAQLTVTDSIVGSEGMYDADTVIMVISPVLSTVSVVPTTVSAETIEDIKVTYLVKGTVFDENEISVKLPWDPADGDFGDISDEIDLAGNPDADVDAVDTVSSLPEDSSAATTSHVTVEYDAAGSSRMNTATVEH